MKTQLPKVRGRYTFNTPLSDYAWLKVGGPADIVFKPKDVDDLSFFLKNKPKNLKVFPIGLGSNLLIRDAGIRGVVIRLGREFAYTRKENDTLIVGAATLDRSVALTAAEQGIAGLEFLASIPGTIGGALKMNAGCYGSEISDVLLEATAIDFNGSIHTYNVNELNYSYRNCGLQEPVVFIEAKLKTSILDSPANIHERIQALLAQREASQPTGEKTGGSTFKNPKESSAWKLIDQVGGRGLQLGDAIFSQKHSNFLINTNNATAEDLENLGISIQKKVLEETGVELVWEVIRVGEPK